MAGVSALLDTSVLIASSPIDPSLLANGWVVSVVSIGELEAGVLIASDPHVRAARLRRLVAILAESPVLPVDRQVADRYGELRAATGRLPSNDLWIAATALAHGFTLLSADERQAKLPLVQTRLVVDPAL